MPQVGTLFRHYKGGLYVVVGSAQHSESLDLLVLYSHVKDTGYPEQKIWARPLQMWDELVDVAGHPVPRFQEVTN